MAKAKTGKRKKGTKPSRRRVTKSGANEALEPARIGRPPKLEDTPEFRVQLRNMAAMQLTKKEAAATLAVNPDTLGDFLRAKPRCEEAWNMGIEYGKASLRRLQWKAAAKGSVPMQKWLGINMLGQANRVNLGGIPGSPIETRTLADFYADSGAA